ncbi:MAG: CvpA family protein [Bernardetiaceae bacterium]|nr:CvpA family protein [Bernardetiaceae bacterium]
MLDIVVIFLVVWGGYKGFKKGLLTELLSMFLFLLFLFWLSWGVTNLFTYSYTTYGTVPPKAGVFIIYLAVFLGVVAVVNLIGRKIKQIEIFEGFDNVMGALFAIFKYVFTLGLVIELLATAGLLDYNSLERTYTYPIVEKVYDFGIGVGKTLSPTVNEIINNMKNYLR